MATPLSELVHFVGEDHLIARARKVVEFIASKPEGIKVLEEAKALHGKPLRIIANHRIDFSGFGADEIGHAIFYNPATMEYAKLQAVTGEFVKFSDERFFVHELCHAAQGGIMDAGDAFFAAKSRISEEITAKYGIKNTFDANAYTNRLRAAGKDEHALRKIMSDIYDTHFGPMVERRETAQAECIGAMKADPDVKMFIDRYEAPAIAFENEFIGKHCGEPARIPDYLGSQNLDEEFKLQKNRERWIDANLAACMSQASVANAASKKLLGKYTAKDLMAVAGTTQGLSHLKCAPARP